MNPHLTVLDATLLGFAGWTLAILTFTVGVHRWSRILTGRSAIHEFPAHAPTGPDWYRRGTRAHLNCVENLPVYGAIVFAASSVGAAGTLLDALGVVILCARIVQSSVHIAFTESRRSVSVRFSFFFVQVIAMSAMIVVLLVR
jgi:uncharacterized MAPEG superfamily protein